MTYTFDENGWQADEIASGGPLRYHQKLHASEVRGERNWLQLRDVTEPVALWYADQYLGEVEAGFLPRVFELRDFSPGDSIAVEPLHPVRVALPIVELLNTGDVRIARYKVLCTEATVDRGVLALGVELDSLQSTDVVVETTVRLVDDDATVGEHRQSRSLAKGKNRLRFAISVNTPRLWTPGASLLYEIETSVTTAAGSLSDAAIVRTGFRTIAAQGTNLRVGETPLPDAYVTVSTTEDVEPRLQAIAGRRVCATFDQVLPFGAYDLADELGIAIRQELPSTVDAARQAVDLLAHHPSVVIWSCPKRPLRKWRPVPDPFQQIVERGDGTRPLFRH